MRKTIILILLLHCLNADIKAQIQHNPNITPFVYGACLGGYVCSANPKQPNISDIDKEPIGGFSIGGFASFRKKKFFFETGINYISEGYAYSCMVTTNTAIRKQENEFKFYSLMVPVRFVLPIVGDYCRHLPSIAANVSFPVKQTNLQTTEYENRPLTKNVYDVATDYNKISPSVTIAYGVEFDLDMIYSLRFEPAFQLSFLNAKASGNKTQISNIGLRVYLSFLR